jgi:hypothetical protein
MLLLVLILMPAQALVHNLAVAEEVNQTFFQSVRAIHMGFGMVLPPTFFILLIKYFKNICSYSRYVIFSINYCVIKNTRKYL